MTNDAEPYQKPIFYDFCGNVRGKDVCLEQGSWYPGTNSIVECEHRLSEHAIKSLPSQQAASCLSLPHLDQHMQLLITGSVVCLQKETNHHLCYHLTLYAMLQSAPHKAAYVRQTGAQAGTVLAKPTTITNVQGLSQVRDRIPGL